MIFIFNKPNKIIKIVSLIWYSYDYKKHLKIIYYNFIILSFNMLCKYKSKVPIYFLCANNNSVIAKQL